MVEKCGRKYCPALDDLEKIEIGTSRVHSFWTGSARNLIQDIWKRVISQKQDVKHSFAAHLVHTCF